MSIIDPSSLRLEALVASDEVGQVRPGATARFVVRGFPGRTFTGRIERLSATADPITRQVGLFVTLPNEGGTLIAGLFANGRIESQRHTGVVVPLAAVDETGPLPTVTRITDGKAERVAVELGLRQAETEMVEIRRGVNDGDLLITGSAKGVPAGTPVTVIG
jgi:multidrug efflux pump subunit AcrA (membrane-fusion protein)